jgi:hypothetical protein
MDNARELISQALQRFCDHKVGLSYIPPCSPPVNGYIRSLNNRLQQRRLNRNHWNMRAFRRHRVPANITTITCRTSSPAATCCQQAAGP